jgi:steroid 5-alpha reductase family enzyme
MINNRLGWFIMELPSLAVFGYFFVFRSDLTNIVVFIPGILWLVHYIHRVLIFPLQIRTAKKQIPVLIVVMAIFFNLVNGSLNGYWFVHFAGNYVSSPLVNIRLVGFIINKYHDMILISLRPAKGDGYKIPTGGLFRYVSCPNFLGEIISWTGFAIAAFSYPALSFLVWTAVNLTTRALDHHRWYQREFPEYDRSRKAIIPFIL